MKSDFLLCSGLTEEYFKLKETIYLSSVSEGRRATLDPFSGENVFSNDFLTINGIIQGSSCAGWGVKESIWVRVKMLFDLKCNGMLQGLFHLLCALPRVHHRVIMPHEDRGERGGGGQWKRGNWDRRGIAGSTIVLNNDTGLAIVSPFAFEFNQHKTGAHRKREREGWKEEWEIAHYHWTSEIKCLFLLLPPVGLASGVQTRGSAGVRAVGSKGEWVTRGRGKGTGWGKVGWVVEKNPVTPDCFVPSTSTPPNCLCPSWPHAWLSSAPWEATGFGIIFFKDS